MKIYLYPEDQAPFLAALHANEVAYTQRMFFRDAVGGGADFLFAEIVGNKAVWVALAAIVIAYIKAHHGRCITVKKGDNSIKVDGLTKKELAELLETADELSVTHTKDEA